MTHRHRRPPSKRIGEACGGGASLSLGGLLRGKKIGRERGHFSPGRHEQPHDPRGKVCHFDVWVWGFARPDFEGPCMPLNLVLEVAFSLGMFTLPMWPLEALEASCEGTSLEEVRKCSSKGGTELKAREEVSKKR